MLARNAFKPRLIRLIDLQFAKFERAAHDGFQRLRRDRAAKRTPRRVAHSAVRQPLH